jgi:hypothetical protein
LKPERINAQKRAYAVKFLQSFPVPSFACARDASPKIIKGFINGIIVISLTGVISACATMGTGRDVLESVTTIEGGPPPPLSEPVIDTEARSDETVLPSATAELVIEGGSRTDKTLTLDRPSALLREAPYTLAFSEISGDQLIRIIEENSRIEYIGDIEMLANVVLTVDVTVTNIADVYQVVGAIAKAGGLSASWEGNRVVMTEGETSVDGFTNGWLVTEQVMDQEVLTVLSERFELACVVQSLIICVGDPLAIERVSSLISSYKNLRQNVPWSVVRTSQDLSILIQAMGLEEYVQAANMAPGVYVLSAASDELLTLVEDAAIKATDAAGCKSLYYEPKSLTIEEATSVVSVDQSRICGEVVSIAGRIMIPVVGAYEQVVFTELVKADRPRPQVNIVAYIITMGKTDLLNIGIEGFQPSIPVQAWPDFLSLIAEREGGHAVRRLEVSTAGQSTAGITTTQRVEGDTVVTGETIVRGIQDRTVGIQLSFDGRVTGWGVIGNVEFSDSAFSGDDTVATDCSGNIDVPRHYAKRLCQYDDVSAAKSLGLTGFGADKAESVAYVYLIIEDAGMIAAEQFGEWIEEVSK